MDINTWSWFFGWLQCRKISCFFVCLITSHPLYFGIFVGAGDWRCRLVSGLHLRKHGRNAGWWIEIRLKKASLSGGFKYVLFHPYLGKWSNLTNIFQMGWNHQPALFVANSFFLSYTMTIPFVLYLTNLNWCFFCKPPRRIMENLQSSSPQLPLNAQAKQIGCVDPRGLSSPTRWDPGHQGVQWVWLPNGIWPFSWLQGRFELTKIREVGEVCVGEDVGVSENGGTQEPWVFLLKMIILGWRLGVPPFKETSMSC